MDPRLLALYNTELAHLRETGAEFAQEFPKVAARLGMEGLDVAGFGMEEDGLRGDAHPQSIALGMLHGYRFLLRRPGLRRMSGSSRDQVPTLWTLFTCVGSKTT